MVRCSTLKRRVKRQRWDINLLNAIRIPYHLWSPIPVTKGKLLKFYCDRQAIPMRTFPRAPTQEMMPGTTTTQFPKERRRVRLPETEAEGVSRLSHKTRTTTEAVVTSAETTSQTRTTSSARTFDERICHKVGKDCESPTQTRRNCSSRAIMYIRRHCLSTTNTLGETYESQR